MSRRAEPPGARGDALGGASARAFRLLLRAYPAAFRAAYGREMEQLFRDQWRDRRCGRRVGGACGDAQETARGTVGFWAAVLWDVVRSAPALRLDALRSAVRGGRAGRQAWQEGPWPGGPHTQPGGGVMWPRRTVAVLAVLGGAYEVVNTGAEVWAGYGGPIGGWALAMVLSTLMGGLLLAAGVALFGRGARATRFARGAAIGCAVLVVGLQFTFPFMSIFARLLGVGIPVALLLTTRGTTGRGPSVPAVA